MIQKKVIPCQTAILLQHYVSTLTKFSIFAPPKRGKSVKNHQKSRMA